MYMFLTIMAYACLIIFIGSFIAFWYITEKTNDADTERRRGDCVVVTFVSAILMGIFTLIRLFFMA